MGKRGRESNEAYLQAATLVRCRPWLLYRSPRAQPVTLPPSADTPERWQGRVWGGQMSSQTCRTSRRGGGVRSHPSIPGHRRVPRLHLLEQVCAPRHEPWPPTSPPPDLAARASLAVRLCRPLHPPVLRPHSFLPPPAQVRLHITVGMTLATGPTLCAACFDATPHARRAFWRLAHVQPGLEGSFCDCARLFFACGPCFWGAVVSFA